MISRNCRPNYKSSCRRNCRRNCVSKSRSNCAKTRHSRSFGWTIRCWNCERSHYSNCGCRNWSCDRCPNLNCARSSYDRRRCCSSWRPRPRRFPTAALPPANQPKFFLATSLIEPARSMPPPAQMPIIFCRRICSGCGSFGGWINAESQTFRSRNPSLGLDGTDLVNRRPCVGFNKIFPRRQIHLLFVATLPYYRPALTTSVPR